MARLTASIIIGVGITAFALGTLTGCQLGHRQKVKDAVSVALQAERAKVQQYRIAGLDKAAVNAATADIKGINDNAKSLKEYVHVYIKGDNNCTLSPDAGRLFDAISAGLPTVPPTATGTETEPSAPVITLSDVAEAELANYEYCRSELAKYQGLWGWTVRVAGE